MSFYILTRVGLKSASLTDSELVSAGLYRELLDSHGNILIENLEAESRIDELEQSQPKWVSVEDELPVDGEKYWHTHIKDDGTFTPVYRGVYYRSLNMMTVNSHSTMAFTHFALSKPPQPPEVSDDE